MPRYEPVLRGFSEAATTDAAGCFVLTGIQAGTRILTVVDEATGSVAETVLELAPGERGRWEAELKPRTGLRLRLLDEAGRPLAGWVAHARRPDGFGSSYLSTRLSPREEEHLLRIDRRSACTVSGLVVDALGAPELGGQLQFHALRTTLEQAAVRDQRGAFELRLPPGPHDLVLVTADCATHIGRVVPE